MILESAYGLFLLTFSKFIARLVIQCLLVIQSRLILTSQYLISLFILILIILSYTFNCFDFQHSTNYSGRKFIAFGPQNDLPKNFRAAKRNSPIVTTQDYRKLDIRDPKKLDDDVLCFSYCRRRTGNMPIQGDACTFGTKRCCFVGLATFSESTFDHWYFVPKEWDFSRRWPPDIVQSPFWPNTPSSWLINTFCGGDEWTAAGLELF